MAGANSGSVGRGKRFVEANHRVVELKPNVDAKSKGVRKLQCARVKVEQLDAFRFPMA